jgi:hypothetical protein
VIPTDVRRADDDRSGGKVERSRNAKVRFPKHRRRMTSGVVIRNFTPGGAPPALLHPLELFAIAPPGQTVRATGLAADLAA